MARNVLESVREDDFVSYYLFPNITTNDEKEQELQLNEILHEVERFVQKHTKDYLWHKDQFKLSARSSSVNILIQDNEETDGLPPHLYGVSHFGDNIDDEWFIVFLLRELTKEIKGLIARVYDSDGEFLLIEAAEYLPAWANPETCENRVYIYNGTLQIVPPTEETKILSIPEALSSIRNNSSFMTPEIQTPFMDKLKEYPGKIQDNVHKATAYVPEAIAVILTQKPNLIAPAIQVFCNRDPVDVKICKAMKYFPPENRVNVRVSFTKCLYAMLTHSKYVPDKRTGWNLPKAESPQYKGHSLGVKIACGFEILAAQAKPMDINQDKGWNNYVKSLTEKGYFKNLLENSRDYNDLFNKAKEYYLNHRDSMNPGPGIGQEILNFLKNIDDFKVEELRANEANLPADDDESWLNITPEDLDKMLEEKYGHKKSQAFTVNNNTNPGTFTEKISQFLEHVSDIDGVEHPDLSSPHRPPRGVKKRTKVSFAESTETTKPSNNTNRISFDPNSFSCAVQNILNFVIPEDDTWNLDSDSDMSDYAEDNYINEETYEDARSKMQEYMEQMDKELASTTIGESFERKNGDSFEDIESFKPVDIDMNALKNIMASYKSQLGEAGPSSNMLGPMGVHLEVPKDD